MTVAELIKLLKKQPQGLTVIYSLWSEASILEASDINIVVKSAPREDSWIHDARPDHPSQEYLLLN